MNRNRRPPTCSARSARLLPTDGPGTVGTSKVALYKGMPRARPGLHPWIHYRSEKMTSFLGARPLACFSVVAMMGMAVARAQEEPEGTTPVRKGVEVYNKLPGRLTILYLRPAGSLVKKGDLVCELDPSTLKEKLSSQQAVTSGAESAYKNAKLPREAAENAVTEYLEGEYKPRLQMLNGKISLGEAEVKRAETKFETTKRQFEKGLAAKERVTFDEIATQRARLKLDQLKRERETLEKFTREKKVKLLQSKVEKERSDELAKQAAYGLAQAAQEQLEKQIAACRMLAPIGGRLVHSPPIEEAADVSEGQFLFRIVPVE